MDFSDQRILVVGDVMIDRYLHGSVERISPEAPVPVVRLGREENRLGGAANVALNIQALGATPLLAGLVGEKENGTLFRRLMQEQGLVVDYLVSEAERCTTVKTRLVSGGQQLMRVDREDTHDITASTLLAFRQTIAPAFAQKKIDLLLFQDYNKGVLTPELIGQLTEMAGDTPIVVDPKAKNFWAYRDCTVFKPNLREIRAQLDFEVQPNIKSLDRAAEFIFEKLDCRFVMITLSEHGIYVHDRHDSMIYPTHAAKIADVSGAGDTVISVVACGLVAGMRLGDIANLANRAGAQVIAKPGVVPVDADALGVRRI